MMQIASVSHRQFAVKCRSATISPSYLNQPAVSRSFWFWHHRRHGWWTEADKDGAQKLERARRIYVYKYFKASGRQPMWGRCSFQNTSNTSEEGRSSNSFKRFNKSSEQQDPKWTEDTAAFEEFKRHIHEDPYAALFGKRLDRLMLRSENNMWSSLNDALDSLNGRQNKETCSPQSHKTSSATCNESHNDRSQKSTSFEYAHTTTPEQNTFQSSNIEYEYDPISMRKVPKRNNAIVDQNQDVKSSAARENPVNIPVKTFRQSANDGDSRAWESSRSEKLPLNEYEASDSSSVHETSQRADRIPQNKSMESRTAALRGLENTKLDQENEPPLFSGTTYERKKANGRSKDVSRPSQSWLDRERFLSVPHPSTAPTSSLHKSPLDNQSNVQIEKLEPSLDRVQSGFRHQKFQTTCPPEHVGLQQGQMSKDSQAQARGKLNAHWESLKHNTAATEEISQQVKAMKQNHLNRSLTKTNVEALRDASPSIYVKSEIQSRPENSRTLSPEIDELNISHTASNPTPDKALPSVEESSDHIVRKSISQPAPKRAEIAQDVAYKERLHAEALDEQSRNQARTAALRNADKSAKADMAKVAEAGRALFRELKALYEQRYGKTDVNHRQEPSQILEGSSITGKLNAPGLSRENNGTLPKVTREVELGDWWKQRKVHAASAQQAEPEADSARDDRLIDPLPRAARAPQKMNISPLTHCHTEGENTLNESKAADSELLSEPQLSEPSQTPTLYKILAYDSSIHRITVAETSSSIVQVNEKPTEVLSRLKRPAKFVPYLKALQTEGYDIVNGSGDLLVLKKKKRLPETTVGREAITDDWGNRGSSASPAGQRVRRRERVFSGSSRQRRSGERHDWDDGATRLGRFGRTLKQVLVTSTLTAGLCYLIGVATEGSESADEEVRRPRGRPGIFSTQDSR